MINHSTLSECLLESNRSIINKCMFMKAYACILGQLTALSGQLAVEFWKLCFHWDADGATQEMSPG